jgi:hypothetical protein
MDIAALATPNLKKIRNVSVQPTDYERGVSNEQN